MKVWDEIRIWHTIIKMSICRRHQSKKSLPSVPALFRVFVFAINVFLLARIVLHLWLIGNSGPNLWNGYQLTWLDTSLLLGARLVCKLCVCLRIKVGKGSGRLLQLAQIFARFFWSLCRFWAILIVDCEALA